MPCGPELWADGISHWKILELDSLPSESLYPSHSKAVGSQTQSEVPEALPPELWGPNFSELTQTFQTKIKKKDMFIPAYL